MVAPKSPPVEVFDPQWLRSVNPQKAGELFPYEAYKAGLKTGRGVVLCVAAHTGELTNCSVVSEDPPGMGFGKSALAVAAVMMMNPWTQQGAPVDGALVRVPIRLNLGDDPPEAPVPPPAKP